jgi:2-iminobutanoate/2-iminopropanoate deaminase
MTTIRRWNPPGMPTPASNFSHAVLASEATDWLYLAGQVGIGLDGKVAEGLSAQIAQCLANVDAGLAAAGMARSDVVKLTFYLTIGTPEAIATYRAARDAWTGSAAPPAATLLIVAGLAAPALLAEVDCVAAR